MTILILVRRLCQFSLFLRDIIFVIYETWQFLFVPHDNSYMRVHYIMCNVAFIIYGTWQLLFIRYDNYDMAILIRGILYFEFWHRRAVERMTKAASCLSYDNDNNDELQRATTATSYIDDDDGGGERRRRQRQ